MFRSFKFFSILGLEHYCIELSPEVWKQEEAIQVASCLIRTSKVPDDVTEREVKLAQDYAIILTEDDEACAMIHQHSNFQKSTLNV